MLNGMLGFVMKGFGPTGGDFDGAVVFRLPPVLPLGLCSQQSQVASCLAKVEVEVG